MIRRQELPHHRIVVPGIVVVEATHGILELAGVAFVGAHRALAVTLGAVGAVDLLAQDRATAQAGEHAPSLAVDLRQRLTLVAFGASADALPETSVVPVVPLPTWASIDTVLMAIHEAVVPKKG